MIMNKIVMVIWGCVIVLLCLLLFLIGYKHRDKEYLSFENSVKSATKSYVRNNRLTPSINDSTVIFIDDLLNADYISIDKVKGHCINNIVYYRGLLFDTVTIDTDCDDIITVEEDKEEENDIKENEENE